jgi:signal transduction histidine kinase
VETPYTSSTRSNRWWISSGAIVASQIATVVLLRHAGALSVYAKVISFLVLSLVIGLALRELGRQQRAATIFSSWIMELLVVAIPLVGLWELFRPSEPPATRAGRLAILLVSILLLALLALMTGYVEHRRLMAELSDAVLKKTQLEKARRELSGRLIRAQEVERSRIGRELHDDLSQQVALLAFGLSQLTKRLPTHKLRVEVLRLLEETKRLSDDVHRLSHELHSSVLDHLGLVAAAQTLCDEVSRQHKVFVRFTETNFPADLSQEVSLCLFRILQEALNNISKHSHASFAHVILMGAPEGVLLTARDDGVGFDPGDKRNRCGLGLLSMSERLCLVGGSLVIDSAPSCGTTVKVWVPTKPAEVPRDVHPPSDPPETFAKPGIAGANDGTSTGTLG